jgi:hypothetical protein
LLIFSYPDTDIHLSRFKHPESTTTDESPRSFFEDEILELFPSRYLLFCFPDEFDFLFVTREKLGDIEIFIGTTELFV